MMNEEIESGTDDDHVDYDGDLVESDNYIDAAHKVSLAAFSQF